MFAVGGKENGAVVGGHDDVGVGHLGHRGDVLLKLVSGPHGAAVVVGGVGRIFCNVLGIAHEGVLLFLEGVLVAQGGEGCAQQEKGQQDHSGHGGKLPSIHGFHG